MYDTNGKSRRNLINLQVFATPFSEESEPIGTYKSKSPNPNTGDDMDEDDDDPSPQVTRRAKKLPVLNFDSFDASPSPSQKHHQTKPKDQIYINDSNFNVKGNLKDNRKQDRYVSPDNNKSRPILKMSIDNTQQSSATSRLFDYERNMLADNRFKKLPYHDETITSHPYSLKMSSINQQSPPNYKMSNKTTPNKPRYSLSPANMANRFPMPELDENHTVSFEDDPENAISALLRTSVPEERQNARGMNNNNNQYDNFDAGHNDYSHIGLRDRVKRLGKFLYTHFKYEKSYFYRCEYRWIKR